jgi:glucose/arabinose dehydrogenase
LASAVACAAVTGCGGGGGGKVDTSAPQIPLAGDTSTSGSDSGVKVPSAPRGLHLVRIGTFNSPTYLAAPPGDTRRVFVVEQPGTIWVVRNRRVVAKPFVDIRRDVQAGGEQGLLSMAFAPDYAKSRLFYVYFTGRDGDIRVQEFQASSSDPDRADVSSRRELLRVEHSEFSNHNGGQLQFGPDGLLYAGIGDGGSEGDPNRNGQNLSRLYSKIIRIDPRSSGGKPYRIPRGNPFAGHDGARPETYAYGLRNPWRFSFDRTTGDMVIADVGQDAIEEVDFASRGTGRGRNWGWSVFEGRRRYHPGSAPGASEPVIERLHSGGACSITGGYVVRDPAPAMRALFGRYVYGDFCDPALRAARLSDGRAEGDHRIGLSVPQLSSFGQDAQGRIYALSLSGPVYRIAG